MLSWKYYVSNIPVNMGIFLLEKILKLKKNKQLKYERAILVQTESTSRK